MIVKKQPVFLSIGVKELYSKGQIVFSKCGRDKGRAFIVYDFNEEYVFIVDGDLRKLEKPKKKKKFIFRFQKLLMKKLKISLKMNCIFSILILEKLWQSIITRCKEIVKEVESLGKGRCN